VDAVPSDLDTVLPHLGTVLSPLDARILSFGCGAIPSNSLDSSGEDLGNIDHVDLYKMFQSRVFQDEL